MKVAVAGSRVEFPMQLDGVRSEDLGFQKLVDLHYKKCLTGLEVRYLILSGSVKERVNKALRYLAQA